MNETKDILTFLKQTPLEVRSLVQGLSDQDIRWRPSDGAFSVIENVCHLRDIEMEGYTKRVLKILHETDPHLPDIDGSRLAVERDYNNQDLATALQAFIEARERNLATLDVVSEEQLERGGVLEGVGTLSLNQLLMKMREHDEGHLDELRIARSRLIARARGINT